MGVGADQGIGIGRSGAILVAELHRRRQEFQVDLVDDAGSGGDDAEVPEGPLRELEELIALGIALKFQRYVLAERVGRPVVVHLYRVIDHQIAGDDRVDSPRVSAHPGHRVPHRRQVDDAGHAGEILEHHPGRHEGNFTSRARGRAPFGQGLHMVRSNRPAAGMTQSVLQEDPDREGQTVQGTHALALKLAQAENHRALAVERQVGSAAEGVGRGGWHRGVGSVGGR
jgi:hypothetical protein